MKAKTSDFIEKDQIFEHFKSQRDVQIESWLNWYLQLSLLIFKYCERWDQECAMALQVKSNLLSKLYYLFQKEKRRSGEGEVWE